MPKTFLDYVLVTIWTVALIGIGVIILHFQFF